MAPRVSTGDRDAVVRQVRWCAAVQTSVNCHCQLGKKQVGNVEPVKFIMQYLTQAAVKLPSAGDDVRIAAFNTRCNLSVTVFGTPARTMLQ